MNEDVYNKLLPIRVMFNGLIKGRELIDHKDIAKEVRSQFDDTTPKEFFQHILSELEVFCQDAENAEDIDEFMLGTGILLREYIEHITGNPL